MIEHVPSVCEALDSVSSTETIKDGSFSWLANWCCLSLKTRRQGLTLSELGSLSISFSSLFVWAPQFMVTSGQSDGLHGSWNLPEQVFQEQSGGYIALRGLATKVTECVTSCLSSFAIAITKYLRLETLQRKIFI